MNTKALLLMRFSLLFPYLMHSQTNSPSKSPGTNDFMIEINFNPFGDDGVFSFENLQTKYWINDRTGLRFGLQLDYKSNSTTENDYLSYEKYKPTVSEKSFLLGFRPGIEFRILQESKISPYWGVEFPYVNRFSNSEYEEYPSSNEKAKVITSVDGGWREIEYHYIKTLNYSYYSKEVSYEVERAYSSYGLNLLFGSDFYVISNLYMGFELGVGYKMSKYKQVEVDIRDVIYDVIDDKKTTHPSSKTSDFGFYYNNSIRLGIYF